MKTGQFRSREKARKTAKPLAPTGVRFVKHPPPEKTPTPPEPEWIKGFSAAWASIFPTRGMHDTEVRRMRDLLTAPPTFAQRDKPRRRRACGPRLLSDDQIRRGKARYNELIDEQPQRWRFQQTAAKEIAAFLTLHETSWQTVEDQIIVPVLYERGYKTQPTSKNKK